jgi:peptidoglycan/LPS O-acetylase OafA/YrhL
MITCYSITIVSSLIIYYLVEKRFMNLGKKLVFKLKTEN